MTTGTSSIPHLETLEQRGDVGVAVDVEARVREAVAAEELPQAERRGRVARADQHDVALLRLDEPHAAQDERAHEELAQLGVVLDDPEQAFVLDRDHLAVLADPRAHGGAGAAQRAHLAPEAARRMDGHRRLAGDPRQHDLDGAGEHDEDASVPVARLGQHFAGADAQPASRRPRAGRSAPA